MTLESPHAFIPGAANNVCATCGDGPNTDSHSEAAPGSSNGHHPPVVAEERPQMGLDEALLSDLSIEAALDSWQSAKESILDSRESFGQAEKVLQGLIGQKELLAGTYRFGRYAVTISDVAAHQRLTVKLVKTSKKSKAKAAAK